MTFQLAEKQYDIPGLAAKLTEKDGQKYIRPKETDLLALLEAGEIDYLFIYRSVGEQHSLNLLLLPDEVNLKRAELADLYATATVELTGKEPGEFITQTGAPMVYGITMPFKAEQQEMALAYIALLLSPEGQAIMEGNGQPSINPAYCEQYDALPDMLKPLCTGPDV
jgi:molybdate/tungstate transport system substrate-binding protein